MIDADELLAVSREEHALYGELLAVYRGLAGHLADPAGMDATQLFK